MFRQCQNIYVAARAITLVPEKENSNSCCQRHSHIHVHVFTFVTFISDCVYSAYNLACSSISMNIFELGHEKMCLMSYANNNGADQPAHPRSLISTFVVRCLRSIISLDSEISRL